MSYSSLSVAELKNLLHQKNIKIPRTIVKKAELLLLLEEEETTPDLYTELDSLGIKIPLSLTDERLREEWSRGALKENAAGFNLECTPSPVMYSSLEKVRMPTHVDAKMYLRGRGIELDATGKIDRSVITPEEEWVRSIKIENGKIKVDWLEHLLGFGWAVVPKAISVEKANILQNEFWEWLESFRKDGSDDIQSLTFERSNPETWKKEYFGHVTRGQFKTKINHQKFLWDARQSVKKYWEELYDSDDLAVSFDGATFLPPVAEENRGIVTPVLHVNQFRWDNRLICTQGMLCLQDSDEEDGGFCFLQPSHLTVTEFFGMYMERHPSGGICGLKVNSKDPIVQNTPLRKVCAKRGDLILFDARLMHAHVPSQRNYEMSISVSYQPRINMDSMIQKDRLDAFYKGIGTTEWVFGPWYKRIPHSFSYGNTIYKPTIDKRVKYDDVKDII